MRWDERARTIRDRQLIQFARIFANAAEPLKKEFVKHRLPNNFIENLNKAVADLESAVEQQVLYKTRQASAVTAIEHDFAECQALLKRVDAIVQSTIGDDPVTMAGWNARRLIVRRSRSTATEEAPSNETPSTELPSSVPPTAP